MFCYATRETPELMPLAILLAHRITRRLADDRKSGGVEWLGPDGKEVTSPRAFVHRSHPGHYGIVNSEAGYQNLIRFLFGTLRVDGILDVDDITLPVEGDDPYGLDAWCESA